MKALNTLAIAALTLATPVAADQTAGRRLPPLSDLYKYFVAV